MAGRNGGVHQAGRRRGIVRSQADGFWFAMGRQVEDAKSGWLFPVRLMIRDGNGLVSERLSDGSLDLEKEF